MCKVVSEFSFYKLSARCFAPSVPISLYLFNYLLKVRNQDEPMIREEHAKAAPKAEAHEEKHS